MSRKKLIGLFLSALTGFSMMVCAVEENKKPEMTFHVTFDKFHANADFSKGKSESTLQASLELRSVEGIKGSALLMENKEKCEYPVKNNLNMKSATVSMWVKPFNWTSEDKRFNHFFVATSPKDKFRIQIYAPSGSNAVLYCEFGGSDKLEKKMSATAPVQWKKDEWHKIDACWDEKSMKIYLDGELGEKVELSGIQFPAMEDASFSLVPIPPTISKTRSSEDRTIIDELTIYDGMLTGDSIKANYASEQTRLSAPAEKPLLCIPLLKSKITIDGKLDEDVWKSASMVPVMIMFNSYPSDKITNAYVYHDSEKLYVGFKSNCANAAPSAVYSKRDDKIWEDDSFELLLFPSNNSKDSKDNYYHFIINSNAAVYDANGSNSDWNGNYECKSNVGKDFWTVEMAIPFKALGTDVPKTGDIWMANFCRNWKNPAPKKPLFTSWGVMNGMYSTGAGKITFSDTSDAVQIDFKPGLSSGDLLLNLKNNCAFNTNSSLKVSVKDKEIISKTVSLKEKSGTEIKESLDGFKNALLNLKITSADSKKVLSDYSVFLYVKDSMEVEYIPNVNAEKCLVNVDFGNLDEKYFPLFKQDKLSLEIKASGPSGIKSEKTFPVHTVKELFELPLKWADGEYTFEYTLKNGTETVCSSKGKLVKPPTPWLNAKAGITDQVLEPWTSLEKAGIDGLSCWGRTYKFNGFLPKVMINQGKDILAGPVSIIMETDKGTFPLTIKETKCAQMKPNRAEFEGNAVFGNAGIEAKWKMWMEYDGLMAVDLSIIPPKEGFTVKSLKMEIPFRKDLAQFIRKPKRVEWNGTEWKSSFEPYVWVGTDDEGLDFFFNSDKNWLYDKKAKEPSETIIKTEKDKALITLNIISQKAEVHQTLDYSFGFQATPVRPLMKDWRKYNSMTRDWKGRNASNYNASYATQFALMTVMMPEEFQKTCIEAKEKGVKRFPYAGALSTPNDNPTYNFFKTEWANPYGSTFTNQKIGKNPVHPGNKTPYNLMPISQASSYTDYLTWQAQYLVDNFDTNSIYTDMDRLLPDENPYHGSGYRNDAFGRSGPTYDILKRRDFYKRLLTICRNAKRGLGLGLRMAHAHDELVLPYHSFNDLFFPGEQYAHRIYQKLYLYIDSLGLDAWRLELNSKASGINHIFLPQFGRGTGDMNDTNVPEYTQSVIAVSLLHDVVTSGSYCQKESIEEIWALKEKTGINKDEAKFIDYWRQNPPVKTDMSKTAASTYLLPDHAVAVVVNFNPEQMNVPVKINLQALGFGAGLTAFDERTGKEITVNGDKFTVSVKGRNYTLVTLKKK